MLISSACYLLGMAVFRTFTKSDIFFIIFSVLSHAGCYKFMEYMSKAKYTSTGELVDGGVDLNMQGGLGECIKDVIILTTGCQVLSLYSNYFWLLWLLVPGSASFLLWRNILRPYFFQQEEKKANPQQKNKGYKKKKSQFVLG